MVDIPRPTSPNVHTPSGAVSDHPGDHRIRLVAMVIRPQLRIHGHVVVRELSHLRIVDPNDLAVLVRPEPAPGYEVHDPQDDGRHDERVREARGRVGGLMRELDPVAVEPPTGDVGDAVEPGYGRFGEDPGQEVAYDAADGVCCEDLRERQEGRPGEFS